MRVSAIRSFTAAFVVAACLLAPASTTPAVARGAARQVALEWNQIAIDTIRAATVPLPKFQAEGFIYMAYVEAAVYDAVTKIKGRYELYHEFSVGSGVDVEDASARAAVVQASYTTLKYYLSDQPAALLDGLKARYDAAVAALPSGGKVDGLAVGEAAAQDIIAFRTGDGLADPTVTFTPGAPGAGVWQFAPAPSLQFAQTPWIRSFDPFLLEGPEQFLPDPPPSLSSDKWARAFNRVKTEGSASSSVRTPEQTAIAWFWNANVPSQYNQAFRDLALDRGFNLVDTVRLFAMGNLIGADSLIECLAAKYHYALWRPVTAIRNAGLDDRDDTTTDLTWTPLLVTPNHPEYPGAHGSITAAVSDVFTEVLGTDEIEVDIPGFNPVTGLTDLSRHFDEASDLREQIIDARTWAGLHYRFSSKVGVKIGRETAEWALERYFQPV